MAIKHSEEQQLGYISGRAGLRKRMEDCLGPNAPYPLFRFMSIILLEANISVDPGQEKHKL